MLSRVIEVVEAMHVNTTTQIQTGHKLSEIVKCSSEIREGDSLSPVLFNVVIVIDKIITAVRILTGYIMKN